MDRSGRDHPDWRWDSVGCKGHAAERLCQLKPEICVEFAAHRLEQNREYSIRISPVEGRYFLLAASMRALVPGYLFPGFVTTTFRKNRQAGEAGVKWTIWPPEIHQPFRHNLV
jgi:hypothetical protein